MAHHEAPESLKLRLITAGGLNRYDEPNFRVVWGETRETWIGGEWVDTDESGNELRTVTECRRVQKYLPADRWYLEKWIPPEHYGSPESWNEYNIERDDAGKPIMAGGKTVPSLGPYPSRGEYEMCYRLDKDGEFAPLEPEAIETIVRMIRCGEAASKAENRASIFRTAEKKEQSYENFAMDMLNDDNQFAKSGHIYVPHNLVASKPSKIKAVMSPREIRAIRLIDMGAQVKKKQEATAI